MNTGSVGYVEKPSRIPIPVPLLHQGGVRQQERARPRTRNWSCALARGPLPVPPTSDLMQLRPRRNLDPDYTYAITSAARPKGPTHEEKPE